MQLSISTKMPTLKNKLSLLIQCYNITLYFSTPTDYLQRATFKQN